MVSQETAEHLFPFGIYTIVHSGRLEDAAGAPRRRLAFTEHHAWVTGARFLQEAGRREQKVAVVFAAAEEIRGVTHWGVLESVTVSRAADGGATSDVVVGELRPLSRVHRLSTLIKKSGGALSQHYIRPYSIIHVPSFLTPRRSPVAGRRRPTTR